MYVLTHISTSLFHAIPFWLSLLWCSFPFTLSLNLFVLSTVRTKLFFFFSPSWTSSPDGFRYINYSTRWGSLCRRLQCPTQTGSIANHSIQGSDQHLHRLPVYRSRTNCWSVCLCFCSTQKFLRLLIYFCPLISCHSLTVNIYIPSTLQYVVCIIFVSRNTFSSEEKFSCPLVFWFNRFVSSQGYQVRVFVGILLFSSEGHTVCWQSCWSHHGWNRHI